MINGCSFFLPAPLNMAQTNPLLGSIFLQMVLTLTLATVERSAKQALDEKMWSVLLFTVFLMGDIVQTWILLIAPMASWEFWTSLVISELLVVVKHAGFLPYLKFKMGFEKATHPFATANINQLLMFSTVDGLAEATSCICVLVLVLMQTHTHTHIHTRHTQTRTHT